MGYLADLFIESVHADIPKSIRLPVLNYANTIPQGAQRTVYLRAASGRARKLAIKAACQHCVGYEDARQQIAECPDTGCALWTHRPYQSGASRSRDCAVNTLPDVRRLPPRSLGAAFRARESRPAAVRVHCLNCMGGSIQYVHECRSVRCPLWLYRPGAKKQGVVDAG